MKVSTIYHQLCDERILVRMAFGSKENQLVGRFLAVKTFPLHRIEISIESQEGKLPGLGREVSLVFRHDKGMYKSRARLLRCTQSKAVVIGMTVPLEIAAPLSPTVVPDDLAVWCRFQEYSNVIAGHLNRPDPALADRGFRVLTMTNEGITVKIPGTKRSFILTTGSVFKSTKLQLRDDSDPIDLEVNLEITGYQVEEHPDLTSRSIEDMKRRDTILELRYQDPPEDIQQSIKKLARKLGYHNFVARKRHQEPAIRT